MPSVPIIAAGWIEIAVSVVVFAFYLLGHLASAMNNKAAPRPQKPRVPPQQQQPRTVEDKLRSEVEEFLRQVQVDEQRQAQPPQRPMATAKPVMVRVEQPPAITVEAVVVRESVEDYVSRHLGAAGAQQAVQHLAEEVSHADEKLEAHLQERFQHKLGALRSQQTVGEPIRTPNKAAKEIAHLLRSPEGVRQIIVASEILRRPEF